MTERVPFSLTAAASVPEVTCSTHRILQQVGGRWGSLAWAETHRNQKAEASFGHGPLSPSMLCFWEDVRHLESPDFTGGKRRDWVFRVWPQWACQHLWSSISGMITRTEASTAGELGNYLESKSPDNWREKGPVISEKRELGGPIDLYAWAGAGWFPLPLIAGSLSLQGLGREELTV